jgi:hypothetical protein
MMKFKYLLILLTAPLIFVHTVSASSRIGGDIFWECNQNPLSADYGKVRFFMNVYVDCSAGVVPQGPSLNLSSNIPGLQTIAMSRDSIYTETNPCHNGCKAIHRYGSPWRTLPGMPPQGGWTVHWSVCCRPLFINNLASTPSSVVIRAHMFAPDTTAGNYTPGVCYDSSPRPTNYPFWESCSNETNSHQFFSHDWDQDSIWYSFGTVLASPTAAGSYATNYQASSPLPGPAINPANVAAVINGSTGEVTFSAATTGIFAVVISVESFRHGQRIAQNFIEFNTVIVNCPPPANHPVNRPPNLVATMAAHSDATWQPVTGTVGDTLEFLAELRAGQRIAFHLSGIDPDLNPNNSPQEVAFSATGIAIGPGYQSGSNCLVTPCASIIPDSAQTSFTNQGATHVLFDWVTTCDLFNPAPGMGYSEYTFNLKMEDDFCPVKSASNFILRVRILPGLPVDQEICAASVDLDADNPEIFWDPLPGGNPQAYLIGRENLISGVVDTVGQVAGMGPFTFIDTTADLANFRYAYFILTESCGTISSKDSTNIHSMMRLNGNTGGGGLVTLNWSDYQGITYSRYQIYRSNNQGPFSPIASLNLGSTRTFTDFQPPSGTNRYAIGIDGPNCSSVIYSNVFHQADLSNEEHLFGDQPFQVYPNPTKGDISIRAYFEIQKVVVRNLTGQVLLIKDTEKGGIQISLHRFPAGTYFIEIIDANGRSVKTKIVKADR